MILPCNFYWFRIDTKHMTKSWLDQALIHRIAYKCGSCEFSCQTNVLPGRIGRVDFIGYLHTNKQTSKQYIHLYIVESKTVHYNVVKKYLNIKAILVKLLRLELRLQRPHIQHILRGSPISKSGLLYLVLQPIENECVELHLYSKSYFMF